MRVQDVPAAFPHASVGSDRSGTVLAGAPYVMCADGCLRMWYGLHSLEREPQGNSLQHRYPHAKSPDGIHWDASDEICIAPTSRTIRRGRRVCCGNRASTRCGIQSVRIVRLHYRLRRIRRRLTWERQDERAGIRKSDAGWDAEMVCYPYVFEVNGIYYMVYTATIAARPASGTRCWSNERVHSGLPI